MVNPREFRFPPARPRPGTLRYALIGLLVTGLTLSGAAAPGTCAQIASKQVAPAAGQPSRPIEFRNVMLIHPKYDIPGYRVGVIPEKEIAAVRKAFEETLPRMIADWSENRVVWKNRVIVSDRPLRTTGGGANPSKGGAEWIAERDVRETLRDHVRWGDYDCIYVYLGYKMNSAAGYGGGGPLGA